MLIITFVATLMIINPSGLFDFINYTKYTDDYDHIKDYYP